VRAESSGARANQFTTRTDERPIPSNLQRSPRTHTRATSYGTTAGKTDIRRVSLLESTISVPERRRSGSVEVHNSKISILGRKKDT
jgi:hypothetical protein